MHAIAKQRGRLNSHSTRRPAKAVRRFRPRQLRVESLEPRQLLTGYSVGLVSQAAVFDASAGGSSTFGDSGQNLYGPEYGGNFDGAVSQDGRYVAFLSSAPNLVSGMDVTPNFDNVYRFDRQTGAVVLVSVDTAGTGGASGPCSAPSISADGSIVAFESQGGNLSPQDATIGTPQIFARNLTSGTTSLVSVNSSGTAAGNGMSFKPVISANGNVVAFESEASNLSPLDTNSGEDVFARNLATGTTYLVSVNNAGTASANGPSGAIDEFIVTGDPGDDAMLGVRSLAISANGDVVAFTSVATDLTSIPNPNALPNVYARNLTTNLTTLVSVNSNGTSSGNSYSFNPVMSADGTVVAFESTASDLTTVLDTNGLDDVFARNLTTGVTSLVSVNSAGTGTGPGTTPVISADGSVVAFSSGAALTTSGGWGVYVRNLATGTTSLAGLFGTRPSISANGNVVAYQVNIGQGTNVYATNLSSNTTSLVSATSVGAAGDLDSENPTVSADGSVVAFQSEADDLVANALGGKTEVYARQLSSGNTYLASRAAVFSVTAAGFSGGQALWGDQAIFNGSISQDGRYVAFVSDAPNLIAGLQFASNPQARIGGEGPFVTNVFRWDRLTGELALVSVNSAGTGSGNEDSNQPLMSADGNVVVFHSDATNLTPSGTGGIFAHNFLTNTTTMVSVDNAGAPIGGTGPSISSDATVVAFDTNSDVYARNLVTNTTVLVSVNSTGTGGGNGASAGPVVSADGRVIAFTSRASNLTAQANPNGNNEVFARNLTTSTTYLVSVNSSGTAGANGYCTAPWISADGSVVAYQTGATDLLAGISDTNGARDVYARNLITGTTYLVSVNRAGTGTGNGNSGQAIAISPDGSRVLFSSHDSDLTSDVTNGVGVFERNLITGSTSLIASGATNVSISSDGNVVAFERDRDSFALNLATDTTELVSVNRAGTGGGDANSGDEGFAMSADGSVIAFASVADNLVNRDYNDLSDVFVAESHPTMTYISVDGAGNLVVADTVPGGNHDNFKISYDSGIGKLIVEDLNGNPINSSVGTGNGTSVVQVDPGSFSGNVVFSGGIGEDTLSLDSSFVNSGKAIQFLGGTGNNSLIGTIAVVDPATIGAVLQRVVSTVEGTATVVAPPEVTISATSSNLAAVVSAVQAITPNSSSNIVQITVTLADGDYSGETISVPAGVKLVIDGTTSSVTFVGHSPAFIVQSGQVTVTGVTFTNTTDAPTILVTGGTLTLRNDVVQESTGFADAAISVTGGSVDLGSTGNPGNNIINVNGSGQLVQASGSGLVSAAGDTFQTNGTVINPLTSTTLTSSANPAFFEQSVTLTATVAALTPNSGTPTGTVSFFDETSGTTLASVALSNGIAKWISSSVIPGSHNVLAVYSGAAKFIPSSSSLVENVSSFSGFLAPLSNNLAFNMNRVIPIKWQLGNSSGNIVTGLSAIVSLQVAPVLSGGVIGTPFNPTPSNGIGLRNDGKQYNFNWDTKGVAVGTYQIRLTLADGTVQTKTLQIVSKGGYAALLIDGAAGTATTGGLLAGDINLYVDNTNGALTPDELARIQDAVTAVDATTEPYGVSVTEVTDPAMADVTFNMDTTSPVGGYADGVLGCTTDGGQITIIGGWNFYAGSDATQIGSGQYDFQTVVTHELGHALGLGHSANGASVMYATLNTGTANRVLTGADLNVADCDTSGACGLHAKMITISTAKVSVPLAGGSTTNAAASAPTQTGSAIDPALGGRAPLDAIASTAAPTAEGSVGHGDLPVAPVPHGEVFNTVGRTADDHPIWLAADFAVTRQSAAVIDELLDAGFAANVDAAKIMAAERPDTRMIDSLFEAGQYHWLTNDNERLEAARISPIGTEAARDSAISAVGTSARTIRLEETLALTAIPAFASIAVDKARDEVPGPCRTSRTWRRRLGQNRLAQPRRAVVIDR
jgi:hypothetical protein